MNISSLLFFDKKITFPWIARQHAYFATVTKHNSNSVTTQSKKFKNNHKKRYISITYKTYKRNRKKMC